MELERELSDGRVIGERQFPAAKRRPTEDVLDTALRILRDKLQMQEYDVEITVGTDLVWEEKDSKSYPGIHTVVRKHIVTGELKKLSLCETDDMIVQKPNGDKRFYAWTK